MQALFAKQNQMMNLRVNLQPSSSPSEQERLYIDQDVESLMNQLDKSSLNFLKREKASPNSITRIHSAPCTPLNNSNIRVPSPKVQALSPSLQSTERVQVEQNILELEYMRMPAPVQAKQETREPGQCFDKTNYDMSVDVYVNPEAAQTNEYWIYQPPKQAIKRVSSEDGTDCSGYLLTPADTVYKVQFKMAFRYFKASGRYSVKDMVIVQGERGEDLGVIVDILPMPVFADQVRAGNHSFDEEEYRCRPILRKATAADRAQLKGKYHEEEIAFQYATDVCHFTYHLPMQILGAEYQFDRTKLFVYYTANSRVDFRELVKNVFSTFKTCIWFKKINKNNKFEPKTYATQALRGVCV